MVTGFQLTPSRRATFRRLFQAHSVDISTHALTEGDRPIFASMLESGHFNSRPHGGRPFFSLSFFLLILFQLTPSRRATSDSNGNAVSNPISTHALTEGDKWKDDALQDVLNFNSRPHGGRLPAFFNQSFQFYISTHALTEGDYSMGKKLIGSRYFNSRPHGGRRRGKNKIFYLRRNFNSRPHGGRPIIFQFL